MRRPLGRWYDFSAGWPGAAAIVASGAVGILVYIGKGSAGKRITGAQYREAIAAGLLVWFVCELNTHDAEGGWNQGVDFAWATLADFDVRGIPRDQWVACAADEHLSQAQIPTAIEFARGFESVIGAKTGCYGFAEFVRACHAAGVGFWYWLAGSMPSGDLDAFVLFWQRNDSGVVWIGGIDCDPNEQLLPLGEGTMTELTGISLAWLEDVMRRMQQLTLNGGQPVNLDTITPWTVGGDFTKLRESIVGTGADPNSVVAKIAVLTAKVDALGLTLGDDEAHIIAAIRTAGAPGPTDVAALAAALAPALVAAMPADSTPEQVADAVLKAMAAHLGSAT